MKKVFKKQTITHQPARRRYEEKEQPVDKRQFRRGQTLTGSSSAKIRSSETHGGIVSPRAMTHHLTMHRRKLLWRLVAVLLACLTVYVLIGQIIANVSVSSGSTIISSSRQALYVKTLDEYFSSRPVERFSPSLNTAGMTSYLQQSYPEIETASIRLGGGFGEASLQVKIRTPIARWNLNGSNEYVDSYGVVFTYSPIESPALQIIDNTGLPASSGGVVTSKRFLGFVGLVVGDMQRYGYQVTKATIPPGTTRQLELTVKDLGYVIKFNTDRSAGEQSEDSSRIIPYLASKGIAPSYVDVRVEGKAFYQ